MSEYSLVIFGLMSVFQALLLPGTLILKIINFRGSLIQRLLYVVALSLSTSYFVVMVLVILGIYKQQLLVAFFVLECIGLIWLYKGNINKSLFDVVAVWWQNTLSAIRELLLSWADVSAFSGFLKALLSLFAFIVSISLLWWSIKLANHYIITIFDTWDSIVSWNEWALSWARGEFPTATDNYPQLMPINYSLAYIFMGSTSIQFFSKFIVLPMAFLILLMPFELGIQTRKRGFFLATIFIYLLLKKFLIFELTNGYVDGVMAFFSLLVVYTLLKIDLVENLAEKKQMVFLGFLFSGVGAIVKQPGVYIFLFYPIWLYFGILKQGVFKNWQEHKKLFYSSLVLSTVFAVPWYIYKQIDVLFGRDQAGIDELINISAKTNYNVGWFQQIVVSLSRFELYLILFLFIIFAFFLLKPLYRWLVITLILPYPILWALIASYDTRNLSIFIPVFGLVAGISIEKLLDWGLSLLDFGKIKLWMAILVVIALGIGLMTIFPNDVLIEKQSALQAQLFSANKNAMLYDLVEQEGSDIKILTSYPLRYLSGFDKVELYDNYKNYATFSGKLENSDVDYLLIPAAEFIEPQIKAHIDEKIANGEYELVWEDKSWQYYELFRVVK